MVRLEYVVHCESFMPSPPMRSALKVSGVVNGESGICPVAGASDVCAGVTW